MATAGSGSCGLTIARPVSRQRSSGLDTTAASGSAGQPLPRGPGLLGTAVVEVHALASGRPARPSRSRWCARAGPGSELPCADPRTRTLSRMIVDSALYRDGVRVAVDCTRTTCRGCATRRPGTATSSGSACTSPPRTSSTRSPRCSRCTRWRSRTRSRRTSDPSSSATTTASSWSSRRSGTSTRRTPSRPGEINLFVGRNYVVSVRHGEGAELHSRPARPRGADGGARPRALRGRLRDLRPGRRQLRGRSRTSLEEDVDEVEQSVFSPDRTQDSQRIYILKRELAEMRRAVEPAARADEALRDRVGALRHPGGGAVLPGRGRPPVIRVSERIETLDDLLSTAFDAHLARISVQQNEDMRKISAWVAIAAVGHARRRGLRHELRRTCPSCTGTSATSSRSG